MAVTIVSNPMPSKPTVTPINRRRRKPTTSPTATVTSTAETNEEDVNVNVEDLSSTAENVAELETQMKELLSGKSQAESNSNPQKKYKCLICEHKSDSYIYMRADHIRSHFKPFECGSCKKR